MNPWRDHPRDHSQPNHPVQQVKHDLSSWVIKCFFDLTALRMIMVYYMEISKHTHRAADWPRLYYWKMHQLGHQEGRRKKAMH